MTSDERLQRRADNKQARALARAEAYHTPVNPAEITDRIFTSQEDEELPEEMCDGHVRMHREAEAGHDPQASDHLAEARDGERRAPLRRENEWRIRLLLTPEPAHGPQLAAR